VSESTARRIPSFSEVVRLCRAIVGAPDYALYVKHLTEHHPGQVPLTEPEFQRERWEAKYSRPGSRRNDSVAPRWFSDHSSSIQ
jgi:uncharacterized short protein YbdD (DUF466 family)